jgi:hypothetical protein
MSLGCSRGVCLEAFIARGATSKRRGAESILNCCLSQSDHRIGGGSGCPASWKVCITVAAFPGSQIVDGPALHTGHQVQGRAALGAELGVRRVDVITEQTYWRKHEQHPLPFPIYHALSHKQCGLPVGSSSLVASGRTFAWSRHLGSVFWCCWSVASYVYYSVWNGCGYEPGLAADGVRGTTRPAESNAMPFRRAAREHEC